MLTKEQIKENKDKFINVLKSTKRKGIDDLVEYLESTDFFTAPASTKYHCDFEGGLCQHSLNVYLNISRLINLYELDIPYDTAAIVSLLHDISKTDFYEETFQNRKLYSETGNKYDAGGRYDWVTIKAYKVKEPELRLLAGDHGYNSVFIIESYIVGIGNDILRVDIYHKMLF